jgi:hypothetical protein
MDAAEDISKRGFRRWYEHRLIQAHVYLVTCFLCMILVATMIEEHSFGAPAVTQLLNLGVMAGGATLGLLSWMRYRVLFSQAERIADRSTCDGCGTYARFDVTALRRTGADADGGATTPAWMRVKCRKCRHEWTIS